MAAVRRVVDQVVAEVQVAAARAAGHPVEVLQVADHPAGAAPEEVHLEADHLEADHLVVGLLVAVRPTASSSAHSSPKPTAAEHRSNHSPQATC